MAATIAWRNANPDKFKRLCKDYRERWPDKIVARYREFKATKPDVIKKYSASYRANNREKIRAAYEVWQKANPNWKTEWKNKNPDREREYSRRRRARLKGSIVEVFSEIEIFDRDGWRCYICGVNVSLDVAPLHPTRAEPEHVIPLARGGSHTKENVRCSCHRCNAAKGVRWTPEEVRVILGVNLGLQPTELAREITKGAIASS